MKKVAFLLLMSALWVGCSNMDDHTARIVVRLTDAPADYEEVNIDIQGVQVHSGDGDSESGWKSLNVQAGVYDILKLTNGMDTLLASGELPAGKVSQIRLILGDNNSLKVNGEVIDLKTPSGQQSGLKLNLNAVLTEGVTYSVLLDFDAARSIVLKGNGGYSLKPVIRAVSEATSGAIKGKVLPVEAQPAVYAINGLDTVATAYTDSTGGFWIKGLPAGDYTVGINPVEGFMPYDTTGVQVMLGVVTDLGEIEVKN